MSDHCVIVLVTTPAGAMASQLSRTLVEESLAACVNRVTGVRSVYRYEGQIHDEAEDLLIIKTTADRVGALEARVRALHSYAVPEFLILRVDSGGTDYLAWVHQATHA